VFEGIIFIVIIPFYASIKNSSLDLVFDQILVCSARSLERQLNIFVHDSTFERIRLTTSNSHAGPRSMQTLKSNRRIVTLYK